MKYFALFLSLIMLPVFAADQILILTCDAPTKRVSGDTLRASDIAGYNARTLQNGVAIDSQQVTSCEYTTPILAPGTYDIVIQTIDTGGLTSDFTGPESVTINSPPMQPSGVKVRVDVMEDNSVIVTVSGSQGR